MNATPAVDVVIAVHTTSRPIERAVASVLSGTASPVRLTVVCHGVAVDAIAARLGALADDPRLRLESLIDGISSPAGPFNRGLELATARFVALLGSDDEFERGAVDSWLREASRSEGGAVICTQTFTSGMRARTPLTRPFRRRRLDPVRDRLASRTAPLGLLATDLLGDARFTVGVPTGEDIALGLQVWFSGAPVSFDRGGPGYLVHDESTSGRITALIRPVAEEFAFLPHVLEAPWFAALPGSSRRSIATKLLRNHVVPAILTRARAEALTETDQRELGRAAARIQAAAPRSAAVLARRDAHLLRLLEDEPAALRVGAGAYPPLLSPAGLLPVSANRLLHRDAPPRLLAAAALSRS